MTWAVGRCFWWGCSRRRANLYRDYSTTPASQYLDMRKTSVYGGSNEIQKNIIAKMILEL